MGYEYGYPVAVGIQGRHKDTVLVLLYSRVAEILTTQLPRSHAQLELRAPKPAVTTHYSVETLGE